jgi:hypothetical protein
LAVKEHRVVGLVGMQVQVKGPVKRGVIHVEGIFPA